jgi:Fur family transcriptional regulator, zinc uptake regulator
MSHLLFPPPGHNHETCVEHTIERARTICADKGVRLTALRERVLREIASSHGAVGAYDIIDRLAREGRRLAPISVYRIIEVLAEAGLVHRLESRNAYFACLYNHSAGGDQSKSHDQSADCPASKPSPDSDLLLVLLCGRCGRVAEAHADAAQQAIREQARALAFTITGSVLELQGLCPDCAGREPLTPANQPVGSS